MISSNYLSFEVLKSAIMFLVKFQKHGILQEHPPHLTVFWFLDCCSMLSSAVAVQLHCICVSCVSSSLLTNRNWRPGIWKAYWEGTRVSVAVSSEVMAIATFQDTSGQRYAGVAGEWARSGSLCKHKASLWEFRWLMCFQILLCVTFSYS